jgi:type IV pilus assembly protein PilM
MASGPIVGIDIGTQQIKAVEMRPGKTGLTVSAIGITPTPFGVMQNNVITDPKLMAQAIKQLFRESGITSKKVVGSVAGQSSVVIRIIEVPRMTDAELKETMKWEVERHVPFAPSETIMDYQPLPTNGAQAEGNPNMEVLLAVAQQDIVGNFVDTLFAAGLDPIAVDIEPLACARALLELHDGRPVVRPPASTGGFAGDPSGGYGQETVATVNIGASNTDISIFQDGQLVFPRSLPLAGDSLTRAIAEILGYPLEQAERVKREYGEVQLDKIGIYTGTAYGDGYDAPQFQDDAPSFIETDDVPLRNPFDTGVEPDTSMFANPFATTPEGPQFDDAERTQPIPKRTLNLASRPEVGGAPPFIPPSGADASLGMPGGTGGVNENALRDQVFEAIAPVLGELATELRRSLDYYRSRAQGRSVDRLILTGGSAALKNFAPFLQSELQVPVEVADPLRGLSVSSRNYDPSYLQTIAPMFAVAVGLAARNAVFDANPLSRSARPPKGSAPAPAAGATVPPTS